jgi:hypothetical protein
MCDMRSCVVWVCAGWQLGAQQFLVCLQDIPQFMWSQLSLSSLKEVASQQWSQLTEPTLQDGSDSEQDSEITDHNGNSHPQNLEQQLQAARREIEILTQTAARQQEEV